MACVVAKKIPSIHKFKFATMSTEEKQTKSQAKRRLKIKESDEAYQSCLKKDQE